MEQQKVSNKIVVGKLELALRSADNRDIGFVYELMRNHMENLEPIPIGK